MLSTLRDTDAVKGPHVTSAKRRCAALSLRLIRCSCAHPLGCWVLKPSTGRARPHRNARCCCAVHFSTCWVSDLITSTPCPVPRPPTANGHTRAQMSQHSLEQHSPEKAAEASLLLQALSSRYRLQTRSELQQRRMRGEVGYDRAHRHADSSAHKQALDAVWACARLFVINNSLSSCVPQAKQPLIQHPADANPKPWVETVSWSPRRDALLVRFSTNLASTHAEPSCDVDLRTHERGAHGHRRVQVYHNFMTAEECDHLVNISRPLVRLVRQLPRQASAPYKTPRCITVAHAGADAAVDRGRRGRQERPGHHPHQPRHVSQVCGAPPCYCRSLDPVPIKWASRLLVRACRLSQLQARMSSV